MKKHRGSGAFLIHERRKAVFLKAKGFRRLTAPGFYHSCASRRAMGSAHRAGWFRGEEKVLKIDGAFAPRVLRFDSGFAAEGCGIAAFGGDEYICCLWYRKPYNRPGGRGKTSKPPFRAMEMHPYSRCAGLPPEGEVLETLCLQVLMKPKANLRANLPLRGGKRT